MSWDTGSAITETRSTDPVLLVAAGTAGWHLVAYLLPSISVQEGWGVWPPATIAATWLSVWAVYAVGLHRLGSPGRRRTAALALVGVSAVAVLVERVATHSLPRFSQSLEDVHRVAPYLIALPLVAAWGLVRRHGTRWAWGLAATAAVLFVLQQVGTDLYYALDLAAVPATPAPPWGYSTALQAPATWVVGWSLPLAAGFLACWLLERYAEPDSENSP